jgi:glycosyltransferase involved in cell wall biosynthesis
LNTRSPKTLALLIPAYNAANFLPRVLRTASAQTRPFDEIWVYDDCSTDDTAKVASQLGAKVVRGDVNRGCSHGKNTLASLTKCDWMHFHDADDELLPGFVARAHQWMEKDANDVVVFGCAQRSEATGQYESSAIHDAQSLSADPVGYTIRTKINANCGLYRRSAFLAAGGFDTDPEVLYNEDVAMHCSLARAGLRFTADPEVMMIYWRREGSMSNANQVKCSQAQYKVLSKSNAFDRVHKYRAEIAERLWDVATASASFLDWETADASGRLAFQLDGRAKSQTRLFNVLSLAGPKIALRVREWLIRLTKPQYRIGYPGWRRK